MEIVHIQMQTALPALICHVLICQSCKLGAGESAHRMEVQSPYCHNHNLYKRSQSHSLEIGVFPTDVD